jgi:hypothetical protein
MREVEEIAGERVVRGKMYNGGGCTVVSRTTGFLTPSLGISFKF